MTELIIGLIVGIVVGWNILPQPQFIKDLWVKLVGK